jgi:hypothetical protein
MLPATQKSVAQKIPTVPNSADAFACRVWEKTYDTGTGSPAVGCGLTGPSPRHQACHLVCATKSPSVSNWWDTEAECL